MSEEGFVALEDLYTESGTKMYSVGATVSDEVVERFGWRELVVRPSAKSAAEAIQAAAGAGIPTPVPQDSPAHPKDVKDLSEQHEETLDHSTEEDES